MRLVFKNRVINEELANKLINKCEDEQLKESIHLAYYKGLKLNEILDLLDNKVKRRTIQYRLRSFSNKVLGFNVTFSMLRNSCTIRLFNKGYSPEFISNYMNYSRLDIRRYKGAEK